MFEDGVPGITGEFVELVLPNGRRSIGRRVPRDGCVLVVMLPVLDVAGLDETDSVEIRSLPPFDLLRLHGTVEKITRTGTRAMLHLNACGEDFHWHPRFVERRRSVRVNPSSLDPISATLARDATLLRGRVRDLSIEGASLVVVGSRRLVHALPVDVELLVHLPNLPQHLRFGASILRTEDEGEATMYAVRLDGIRSRLFHLQQREIQNYALRRQVALVTTRG